MEIGLLLSFVVFLAVLYFLFKLAKTLIKTLIMAAVVLVVIIIAAGFLVISDVRDLKDNFSNSSKLVLFAGEDRIAFGLEVTSFDAEGVKTVKRSTLDGWEEDYEKGRYKKIRGDYYKVFIIKDDEYNAPLDTLADHMDILEGFFSEGNVATLLVMYRTGDLIIYPETPVFKLVKLIPEKWVMKLDKKLADAESD